MLTQKDVLKKVERFFTPDIVFIEVRTGQYYASTGARLMMKLQGNTYTGAFSGHDIDTALRAGYCVETQMLEVA